jgi:hypothetical protein
MERHARDEYLIVGEGVVSGDPDAGGRRTRAGRAATADSDVAGAAGSAGADGAVGADAEPVFRFSRLGPKGTAVGTPLRRKLAAAMTQAAGQRDSGIAAGFTYLGQFIDHDLTFDPSPLKPGTVPVAELEQRRSPNLDLDSLYGLGPVATPQFYRSGRRRLKVGKTDLIPGDGPPAGVANTFDLPRSDTEKHAVIPDHRNDENLAVGQTHLAFIKFHNRVVDLLEADGVPAAQLFERARDLVVRHYQWMIKTDFLPQLVRPTIVDAVFRHGRKIFEVNPAPGSNPTMPVEFSVACYRLGHSMVRAAYDWNRVFDDGGGSLDLLFNFSGTSGFLGEGSILPSNWIADFRRLYDFSVTGRPDLEPFVGGRNKLNFTRRIDTLLADPLANLPDGSIGGPDRNPDHHNLAFRNLDRARMLQLATGQQLAKLLNDRGVHVRPLTRRQILLGRAGAKLEALTVGQQDRLVANTPLWFYILREAEVNNGELVGVGGQIVAETFHRAMEGSRISIVKDPAWRPTLGPDRDTFRMVDLLLVAHDGQANQLNPLGDPAP